MTRWVFRVIGIIGYIYAAIGVAAEPGDGLGGGCINPLLCGGNVVNPPTAPTGVSVPATNTSGSYTLQWQASSGWTGSLGGVPLGVYQIDESLNNGSWQQIAQVAGNLLTHSLSGKANGTSYAYRVRACNPDTNDNSNGWKCSSSTGSNQIVVRHQPTAAAKPTHQSTSTGSLTVNWSASSNATYYLLQKRQNNGSWVTHGSNITTLSAGVNGLSDGSWDFRIQACNGFSWSCNSFGADSDNVTVRNVAATPVAPTGPSSDSDGRYTLSWSKPSGTVTYYELEERKNNSGSWTSVATTSTTSKELSGRSDGAYDYRVRACNGYAWACSGWSAISADVNVLHLPSVPGTITAPGNNTTGVITVNWSAASGQVTDYRLEEQNNGTWTQVATTNAATTSISLSNRADSTYYYQVRACNGSGCSAFRTTTQVTTVRRLAGTPSAPSLPAHSNGSLTLSWGATSHATYYNVQKRLNGGSWSSQASNLTTTSLIITGLSDGTWDYRIQACNTYSWACSGWGSDSSDVVVRSVPSVPLVPVHATTDTDGNYSVSWLKPSGTVTYYDLQERKNNASWVTVADNTTATSLSLSAKTSGNYDYRVIACNGYDWACSVPSVISNPIKVRHIPHVPVLSLAASDNDGQYSIGWNAVNLATEYQLEEQFNGGQWNRIATINATQTNVTGRAVGQYGYRIKACHEFNWACSGVSAVKLITVTDKPAWAETGNSQLTDKPLVAPSVPAQQSIGALEGQAGVSGGKATYQIPIALPPGRSGMQPGVSLNYSSGSGNGIAGMGWSLNAGSSIHRCGRTVAQDDSNQSVTYDAAKDRLCLDGARLIATNGNNYGTHGTQYRTELDSFARVTQNGDVNGTATSFTVEHADNRISIYGGSNDSRHNASGRSEHLSWAISRVKDRTNKQNTIKYYYGSNFGQGEKLLTHITYSGDENVDGDRKVSFEYEVRPDSGAAYLAGGLRERTRRLKTIKTWYSANQIREYTLNYGAVSSATKRSLLRSVTECAYKNSVKHCLPATTFSWQDSAMKYTLQARSNWETSGWVTDSALPVVDVDGDGRKEFIVTLRKDLVTPATHKLQSRRADGTLDWSMDIDSGLATSIQNNYSRTDINNDGLTDFLMADYGYNVSSKLAELIFVGVKITGSSASWEVLKRTGITFSHKTSLTSFSSGGGRLIDINADGKTDIIRNEHIASGNSYATRLGYYLNIGSDKEANFGSLQQIKLWPQSDQDFTKVKLNQIRDINGDGLMDVMLSDSYCDMNQVTDEVLINNGSGFTSKSYAQLGIPTHAHPQQSYHLWVDINNDGLEDYLYVPNSSNHADNASKLWRYQLNTGNGFAASKSTGSTAGFVSISQNGAADSGAKNSCGNPIPAFTPKYQHLIHLTDYDNDGRQDLVLPKSQKPEVASCHLRRVPKSGGGESPSEPEYIDVNYCTYDATNADGELYGQGLGGADASIYTVQAWRFERQSNGDYVPVVINGSEHLATPSQRYYQGDMYGDGLNDLFLEYTSPLFFKGSYKTLGSIPSTIDQFGLYAYRANGATTSSSEWMKAPDELVSVQNGLGQSAIWSYQPLSTGAPLYNVPTSNRYIDDDHFYFSSSMRVVNEFKQSNGLVGGFNSTQYQYHEAMYNNKGRGFQGFRRIVVDSPDGLRAVSYFNQKFPLAGKIQQVRTCLQSENDNTCLVKWPLSRTRVDYHVKKTHDGLLKQDIYWVAPVKTIKKTRSLSARALTYLEVSYAGSTLPYTPNSKGWLTDVEPGALDNYGNILKSTTKTNTGFGWLETQTSSVVNPIDNNSTWWPNQLTSTTVTTKAMTGRVGVNVPAGLDTDKTLKTEFTYDPTTRLTTEVVTKEGLAVKSKVVTSYNNFGQATAIKTYDSENLANYRQVLMAYSTTGDQAEAGGYFVYKQTNQLGHSSYSKVFPEHGQSQQSTDINGLISKTEYDPFGRVEKVIPPVGTGQPVYSRYAACNLCDGLNNPLIRYKVSSYQAGTPLTEVYKDMFNRVLVARTQGFDGSWIYTRTTYDALGRKTFESIPSASLSETEGTHYKTYDVLSRLTRKETNQTASQLLTIDYSYDKYKTTITANGLSMSRTYSGIGQLMQTTDAVGGITEYAYDGRGNPIVLEDAKNSSITATYNALGQKLWVDDPNMGKKTFNYTGYGEVKSEVDANSQTTSYVYDDLGRLLRRNVAGTLEASFVYDTAAKGASGVCQGAPASESIHRSGESYQRSYHYDGFCRLTSTSTNIDGTSYTVSNHYDANYGRAKGLTYPGGLTLAYDYNNLGYLTHTKNAQNGYVYRQLQSMDVRGQWTTASIAGNQASVSRSYYAETGQMKTSLLKQGSTQLQRLDYDQYDAFGNLKQQTVINHISGQDNTDRENFVYDNLHRLTRSTRTFHGGANISIDYAYDAVGNLLKKSDFSANNTSAYQYVNSRTAANGWAGPNAVRNVTLLDNTTRTYSYDQNGNLTNDGLRTITYNAFNKPTRIQVASGKLHPSDANNTNASDVRFYYGADQLRYKQTKTQSGVTKTTVYIGKLYEQVTTGSLVEKKSYLDGIAILTQKIQNNTTTNKIGFLHRDRLGSMTLIVNDKGAKLEGHSFDPFGRPRTEKLQDSFPAIVGSSFTTRGFTEHEHLDDSQLIHMNGRAYDYNLGRFLSVDPFIQEPGNSQSMNPYSYIMNNPLAGTDPSGYMSQKLNPTNCNTFVVCSAEEQAASDSAYGSMADKIAAENGEEGSNESNSQSSNDKSPDSINSKEDEQELILFSSWTGDDLDDLAWNNTLVSITGGTGDSRVFGREFKDGFLGFLQGMVADIIDNHNSMQSPITMVLKLTGFGHKITPQNLFGPDKNAAERFGRDLGVLGTIISGAGALKKGVGLSAKAFLKRLFSNGDSVTKSGVWKLKPTERGNAIEAALAKTDYKDWFNVGSLNKGYFPLVDFQKGNTLVSLKSVDTAGSTWMGRMTSHIDDLATRGATVNGQKANMVLDLRVQAGGAKDAASLVQYGRQQDINVVVKEF